MRGTRERPLRARHVHTCARWTSAPDRRAPCLCRAGDPQHKLAVVVATNARPGPQLNYERMHRLATALYEDLGLASAHDAAAASSARSSRAASPGASSASSAASPTSMRAFLARAGGLNRGVQLQRQRSMSLGGGSLASRSSSTSSLSSMSYTRGK